MKKLKNWWKLLIIVPALITSVLSCSAQNHGRDIVGELIDDSPKVTMENRQLTENWQQVLSHGGVEINITEVTIVQNREGLYFLMGTNEGNSIESCIALVLENGKFFELLTETGGGLTVSCSGCALGCHPEIVNGKGYCLPLCTPCTKTETLNGGAILSN